MKLIHKYNALITVFIDLNKPKLRCSKRGNDNGGLDWGGIKIIKKVISKISEQISNKIVT